MQKEKHRSAWRHGAFGPLGLAFFVIFSYDRAGHGPLRTAFSGARHLILISTADRASEPVRFAAALCTYPDRC